MISVVVPVYNAARYLALAVASVQAQTLPDWELLLVDDGSKDNSPAIAEALRQQDSRIRTFSQPNAGAAAARNRGLAEARADYPYALCLDSDDLLIPDALQTLLSLLDAHADAPAACGSLQDIDAEGQVITNHRRFEPLHCRRGVDGLRLVWRQPDAPVAFGDLCFRNHIVTPGQVLMRKSALAVVGGFDVSLVYVEDHDLWWRLTMQVGPIVVTLKTVMLYRHHGASLSSNKKAPRRGAAALRWRLLTLPQMTVRQRQTARIGRFHDCLTYLEYGAQAIQCGDLKSGLKNVGLSVRNMLLLGRDLARARKQRNERR